MHSIGFLLVQSPELYEQYHVGFRHQVEQWPVYPVSMIGKWLVTNFCKQSSCVVADFGCGVAALAQELGGYNHKGTCPFRVHSFDLVAASDLVTACDMANVPLKSKTVDVAVFCLSLMGTNLADLLREAHRVLKDVGILKIAEVRSRFESTDKKDELEEFVLVLDKLGFKCLKTDRTNKMFVMLECKKTGKKPKADLTFTAKPCIYKRR
jgi:ribosomal RNA-processing protein 8